MATKPTRSTAIGGMGPNRIDARYHLRILPCFSRGVERWTRTSRRRSGSDLRVSTRRLRWAGSLLVNAQSACPGLQGWVEWRGLDKEGMIPGFEQAFRFLPKWTVVTRVADDLVEVSRSELFVATAQNRSDTTTYMATTLGFIWRVVRTRDWESFFSACPSACEALRATVGLHHLLVANSKHCL